MRRNLVLNFTTTLKKTWKIKCSTLSPPRIPYDSVFVVKQYFAPFHVGLGLRLNSPFKAAINLKLRQLREAGIVSSNRQNRDSVYVISSDILKQTFQIGGQVHHGRSEKPDGRDSGPDGAPQGAEAARRRAVPVRGTGGVSPGPGSAGDCHPGTPTYLICMSGKILNILLLKEKCI